MLSYEIGHSIGRDEETAQHFQTIPLAIVNGFSYNEGDSNTKGE